MAAAEPYRVLARKYRPRSFAEVLGQEHIVRALGNAVERGRIGQAYLFVGPRGVGKTTLARIIAKAVNCEKGPTAEPCLECDPCREIERGGDVDVVEIDGASHNGVEDVRGIRDAIHTHPLRDRRRIYIVDEVQRLSGQAFDALLKTLEEPPAHAMFVFATTDPHKIPDTIVSRCQTFEFRRLREVDVRAKLEQVCAAEGAEVPEEVLAALARGCRGGLRDAESMLDQVLSFTDGAVTLDDLEMVAGLARPERWLELYEAVASDDGAAILRAVEAFLERGGSERDFVEQAVDALRDLLHVALLGEDALGVEPEPERRERMRALAKTLGRDRMEALLGMMFELEARMQRAPLGGRALLEWTLLRAARLGEMLDLAALAQALPQEGGAPPQRAPAPAPAPSAPAPAQAPRNAPAAPPAAGGDARALEQLLQRLDEIRPTYAALVRKHFAGGAVQADGVLLELHEPPGEDREILDDRVEREALGALPGSPGPWTLEYRSEASPSDSTGARLIEAFGGKEETP